MQAIEFEKVCFSYKDDVGGEFGLTSTFSLQEMDLSIAEGEFVAVLGHNGSGKSTLARLTNGLLSPKSGKITVLGMDATKEENLFEVRKNVGIVFQNPDNQTVASIVEDDVAFGPENVGIPREEIGERIEFALNTVGMQAYRYSSTTNLSGGQKQRIAIAGVLALKPRIMILDESTAMLDPRGRKEVLDVVLRLNKEEKVTVLLITHFPDEALLADRVIVMDHGKIAMQGTPQEVLSRQEELKKCSLSSPVSLQISRELSRGGMPVEDAFTAEGLADSIAKNLKMGWAGMRLTPISDKSRRREDTEYGRIVCQNLSYAYNKNSTFATQALSNVSLQIESGAFFGIIGHTGSGKSTFVQHLNALITLPTADKKYKPKKGKKAVPNTTVLTVSGFDLTDKKTDFKALRSKIGMVFQYPEHQLFAETVFEDVAFGLKNFSGELTNEEKYEAVKTAIETVGLSFESVKNRSPFELSGGQRRRVAIAGVIVTKPEILVLDEPAAGLDPLGKKEIMALLHKLHGDWCKTVVIVSHDMDEIAENCDSLAIFSKGSVLASGTPHTLFSTDALMRQAGLDVPFTARLCKLLREKNIEIACDFTVQDFIRQTLDVYNSMGAGMRSTREGGGVDA